MNIYDRYNDDIASEDREHTIFDDYTEAVSDSDEISPLTGTLQTYLRVSLWLTEKSLWEQVAQKQSVEKPAST